MTHRKSLIVIALVFVALSAQAETETTAVFESMRGVLDMAYEIERYALQHGRLPAAKSPTELSQALLGTDSMADLLVDAWGTPLHIHSDPGANTYVVASAGSDRKFEQGKWSKREATRSAAEDIVMRNGVMVRSPEAWALERFQAEGGDAVESLGNALEVSKAARTMADMMTIQTAIELYAADHGELPAASDLTALAAALEPKYLRNVPRTDGWGNPFTLKITPAAKTYRIVSAGSDGKFDATRWTEKGKTFDYARDAVLQNGEFAAQWEIKDPARKRADAYAGYTVFKLKHASLGTLSDAERRKLRLQGLMKDADAAAADQDFTRAITLYEEGEKLDPEFRHAERLRNWSSSFTLIVPPPPGQRPAPRPIEESRQREAAARIAAALRRALPHVRPAEQWNTTMALADLERERGEAKAARQLIDDYMAAHPEDPAPLFHEVNAAIQGGELDRASRLVDDIVARKLTDKEQLYMTGVAVYELVAKSGDKISTARKKQLVASGRAVFDRALKLDPEYFEAVVYLNLLVRQEALLEPDEAKQKKLIEEADALRARAIQINQRRRSGS